MNRFNVRVYGIYLEEAKLLLTDEIRMGMYMTKLPGGGLEFGEGTVDALKREWREELEVEIEVGEILYVNPFYQESAINPLDQVISLYYPVQLLGVPKGVFVETRYDFPQVVEGAQVFRYASLAGLTESDFTFPIDKALLAVLKEKYK